MSRALSFVLLTVVLLYCFSFSGAEEEPGQKPANAADMPILHPLLDEETANILREVRPDIQPRFILPGWIPWIPIRLPIPRPRTTRAPTPTAG